MQKCWVLPAQVARSLREGEASLFGQQAAGLVSTSRHGRRELAPYAKAWRMVAAQFWPWRRYGSGDCSPTPLLNMGLL
jgi:hypothetical protein